MCKAAVRAHLLKKAGTLHIVSVAKNGLTASALAVQYMTILFILAGWRQAEGQGE